MSLPGGAEIWGMAVKYGISPDLMSNILVREPGMTEKTYVPAIVGAVGVAILDIIIQKRGNRENISKWEVATAAFLGAILGNNLEIIFN